MTDETTGNSYSRNLASFQRAFGVASPGQSSIAADAGQSLREMIRDPLQEHIVEIHQSHMQKKTALLRSKQTKAKNRCDESLFNKQSVWAGVSNHLFYWQTCHLLQNESLAELEVEDEEETKKKKTQQNNITEQPKKGKEKAARAMKKTKEESGGGGGEGEGDRQVGRNKENIIEVSRNHYVRTKVTDHTDSTSSNVDDDPINHRSGKRDSNADASTNSKMLSRETIKQLFFDFESSEKSTSREKNINSFVTTNLTRVDTAYSHFLTIPLQTSMELADVFIQRRQFLEAVLSYLLVVEVHYDDEEIAGGKGKRKGKKERERERDDYRVNDSDEVYNYHNSFRDGDDYNDAIAQQREDLRACAWLRIFYLSRTHVLRAGGGGGGGGGSALAAETKNLLKSLIESVIESAEQADSTSLQLIRPYLLGFLHDVFDSSGDSTKMKTATEAVISLACADVKAQFFEKREEAVKSRVRDRERYRDREL